MATVNVDKSQLAFAVEVVAQSFTLVGTNVAPEPGVSFVKIVIVWFVSYAPVDVSLLAIGAGGTVGVNVDVAF